MNLQQLYHDIKQELQRTLAKGAEWMPELCQEQIRLEESKSIEAADAWQVIRDFYPTEGWVQTLDKTGLLQDFDISTESDIIRAAEFVNEQAQSLHIRPARKGQLICTVFSSDGGSHFYTESKHQIKHRQHKGQAIYRLYWEPNMPQTQPKFSRLVKIDLEGTK